MEDGGTGQKEREEGRRESGSVQPELCIGSHMFSWIMLCVCTYLLKVHSKSMIKA
jgi:hypothetical protein